jgi:hypothetical protein
MCSTSPLLHPPARAPYVVVRLIVNLMRSSNSNFTLSFIVNPGMLVITPVPVITTSTRTRRTYSSHRPTDRNAVIPRRRYASSWASSRMRRAALLERRYQFFETARRRLALTLSVFVERFIEHRVLAISIAFFQTSSRPISNDLESRTLSFLSSPGWIPVAARYSVTIVIRWLAHRVATSHDDQTPRKVQFSSVDRSPSGAKSDSNLQYRTAVLLWPRRRELVAAADSRSRNCSRRDSILASGQPTLNLRRGRLARATAYCAGRIYLSNRRKLRRGDCWCAGGKARCTNCALCPLEIIRIWLRRLLGPD